MPTTTNGVPYQALSDQPNGAGLGQGIAEWLEDNLGGGTTQQVLTADQAQAAKVAFKYPKARTAAPTPTGDLGDLWVPSSGADAGELYVHNGTSFVRVKPVLTGYPKGLVDPDIGVGFATKTADQTVSSKGAWVDVTDLSVSVALAADRRYVVSVQAAVQVVFESGQAATSEVFGQILVNGTARGRWCHFGTDSPTTGQARYALGYGATPPFVGGGGGAVTIKAQVWSAGHTAVVDCASDFPGWLRVDDVGPSDD